MFLPRARHVTLLVSVVAVLVLAYTLFLYRDKGPRLKVDTVSMTTLEKDGQPAEFHHEPIDFKGLPGSTQADAMTPSYTDLTSHGEEVHATMTSSKEVQGSPKKNVTTTSSEETQGSRKENITMTSPPLPLTSSSGPEERNPTPSEETQGSRKENITMTSPPLPLTSSSGPEERNPTPPAQAEVALFTTWVTRPYKRVIHDNVLRTWPLISPSSFACMLFSDEEEERQRARSFGWLTPPPSPPPPPTACGGVPIFRELFYAAMRAVPSAQLVGFVNGDLLLGAGLGDTLQAVLRGDPGLMSRPLLLLLCRYNVPFQTEPAVHDLGQVEEIKPRGTRMSDGSSDAFFTNRLFPWWLVPDVVPGRKGIGMWLVAAARALKVTVIDLTPTVTALHMTSSAGLSESSGHVNPMCNRQLLQELGVEPSSWACGFLHCAEFQSQFVNGTSRGGSSSGSSGSGSSGSSSSTTSGGGGGGDSSGGGSDGGGGGDGVGVGVRVGSKARDNVALPAFCHNCRIHVEKLSGVSSSTAAAESTGWLDNSWWL